VSVHRVDYDQIAHLYDERIRDHPPDTNLAAFLENRSKSDVSVLDVGCGTGKQLAVNRSEYPGIRLVGLDRFREMLKIAMARCGSVTWIQGDGTCLPFLDSSFDYACNQFSYPHIRNKEALMAELFRALKPGGRFVMSNIDPWRMPKWNIYRFFPEARVLDEQDFLPVADFVRRMEAAGFGNIRTEHIDIPLEESLNGFLEYASTRHRNSQFIAISDEAYRKGLERIEDTVRQANDPDAMEDASIIVVRIAGDKPENR
jgi:ubiquinone/menaquinone biosynthesis C-methylase UbiE